MSSGFSGSGPDFYTGGGITGRSMMNMNNPQGSYRPPLAGILPETASQILHPRPDLIGKRSLAEFQQQQFHQQQQQQNLNLYLRNVKARSYQHTSPISPLSPVDFSISPENSSISSSSSRYRLPIFQQLRQQNVPVRNPNFSGVPFPNFAGQDSEKKMRNRLEELEKELLNDDAEQGGDAISVVTNSEWSETIQNLITPTPKPISPCQTSSSSSCSSTSASPPVTSPKQLIMEVATAISEENLKVAREILPRLEKISNINGSSEQRLTAYMTSALKSRVNAVESPPPVTELYGKDHLASTQDLYEISPCFKLGFMAANHAILEVVAEQTYNKIHVIDFDIGKGGQYFHLLHALSRRKSEKQFLVKVTTFADFGGEERLKMVGDGLKTVSSKLGITFSFNVMNSSVTNLSKEMLGVESDEALCVNLAFRLYKLPDESVTTENLRDELLRCVKKLSPVVVTVVEQQMNANTAPLVARVAEACGYYGALFESLEAIVPREHPDRVRIEEGLGRKISNSVACEGRDRVERCEVFGKWRARMGMAGFELKPLTQIIADSLRSKLNSAPRGNPGFTVNEDAGGICFGWMGRTLTVASAWR